MIPIGIISGLCNWGPTVIFITNFLAIVPLAVMMSFATEQVSQVVGATTAALLNATFGNAVELVVSAFALINGHIDIVQWSMLGSILSNLLLVPGASFLCGNIAKMRVASNNGVQQTFNPELVQTASLLMVISAAMFLIVSTFSLGFETAEPVEKLHDILVLSRTIAILSLALYIAVIYFQHVTHHNLFKGVDEEHGEAELGAVGATLVLLVITVLVTINAHYLVDSIDSFITTNGISKGFVGVILIPIIGNAVEHWAALDAAVKDNMDLSLAITTGSSIQMAFLITPLLVLFGWVLGQPMSLDFGLFGGVNLVCSVLVLAYTMQDGKSNYLEGVGLIVWYIVLATAYWFFR
ncbi:Vacuolar calcium ion transporter 2 [Colletotrichum truncatum]|uniref:Vacuolar calcium ion transporter 2 n=1 Tax=Colletotrichum truncatum TaxID=5467 RepID=A0ACC3YC47_COLTU